MAGFRHLSRMNVEALADIVVSGQDALSMLFDGLQWANDSPCGERRFVRKPTGLRCTIANGTVTFWGNDWTVALPGKLLQRYDTVG